MNSRQNGAVMIHDPGSARQPPELPVHQPHFAAASNGGVADGGERSSSRGSATGRGYWKHHLFLLQESAPKPKAVFSSRPVSQRPPFYQREFHGLIPREMADRLLAAGAEEGSYLVRESQRSPGTYTLCMRFDGQTKNYKLFYDGQHYVGEKRFDSLDELVADGLICMYMDKHAAEYIRRMTDEVAYEESPYSQYQRMTQRMKRRAAHNSPEHVDSRQRNLSQSSVRSVESEQPRQKAHRFKSHTFRIASFCDYCGNFMWGLVQQGLRCEDCGFAAHKKCSEKTRLDCQPDLKYVKRMFAVDLTTLCMAHGRSVPPVVERCVGEVEERGLDMEGIYRISGSHDEIEKLRLSFDVGASNMDLSQSRVDDIHSVAGLLKLYFRLLPQPLITFSVYRRVLQLLRQYRADYERCKNIRKCLEELPSAHLETLKLLVRHLSLVADHANVNKMTSDNLAMIFAPTILCHPSPQNMLFAMPQQEQYVLQYLIVNHKKLFG